MLDRIKSHRGTAIRPQQTGPVIDVLYSAAGNSADEAYYSNGIIGYDFEIGAQHYNDTGSGTPTCNPGQQPPFGDSTNDCLDNEGFHEAMEFASGNYGLLEEALEYSDDTTAPNVGIVSTPPAGAVTTSYSVRFTSDEAASIYYTIDGSTPTTASTEYKPPRARALPEPVVVPGGATLKWIAHDFKGNMSAVKSQAFIPQVSTPGDVSGTVPPTLSLTLGAPASFGAFTPGIARDYLASMSANVISTAGDATLSVTDPSSTNTGRLVNGIVRAGAAAAGQRERRRVRAGRRLGEPDDAAHVSGAGEQRRGGPGLQAVDRGERAAAHGHLQQDADLHAVDHEPVAPAVLGPLCPVRGGPKSRRGDSNP